MPDNPYTGAAEGAMSSALSFAQSLRSAADQQQRMQDQIRQRTLSEQLHQASLLNEGWQYYDPSQNVKPEESGSGLKTRDYAPPPDNLVTFPTTQRQMFRPSQTAKEKQAADKQQDEGQKSLAEMLQKGGEVVSPQGTYNRNIQTPDVPLPGTGITLPGQTESTGIPVSDPNRTVSMGGKSINIPTGEEADQQKLQAHLKSVMATQDAEGWVLPDSVASNLEKNAKLDPGSLHGVKLPHEVVAEAFRKATDAKQDKYAYNHFQDENGRVSVTRIGSDGTPQKWDGQQWANLAGDAHLASKKKYAGGGPAASSTPKPMTAGQEAVQGRFDARQMRTANTLKNTRLAHAEDVFARDLKAAAGDTTKVNAARARLNTAKQTAQSEYEENLKPSAPQQQAKPAAAATAKQAAPQKAAAPKIQEGTIIRNGTGVRLKLKGGKWVPA